MEQKLSGTILSSESLGIENTNNFNTKHFNIKQEKMTAVGWLALRYHHRQGYLSQEDIAEAKSMEKEQIKDAYWNGTTDMEKEDALLMGEDYFNEYYKK
jgi:uncharacterized protein YgiM (DUF1202 family)